MNNQRLKKAKLTKAAMKQILGQFKEGSQGGRILEYLAEKKTATSLDVTVDCGCSNVSAVIKNNINPKLAPYGVSVLGIVPKVKHTSSDGRPINAKDWGIYKIVSSQ